MSQDINRSTCSSLTVFMYRNAKDKEVYFMYDDQKAWTASVQSFTLWQQAITEITLRDHSIIACSRPLYIGVVLCAHCTCGESHFQRNINWLQQQRPLLFPVNRTYRTFFLWRLHLAPPSHPGQSTTLLWLESPGGKYAKLLTLWQQAKIEIPRGAHSISACLRHIYMGVVLHVHPVRGESHIQHNTNRVGATPEAKLG